MVKVLRLTDAFIWEDLPTIDTVTGSRTMASWIPRIQGFTFIFTTTAIIFHVVQSSIRLSVSDDRPFVYATWYPFDVTKSPIYELINVAQGIGTLPSICFIYGLPAFFATAVCVACSQLESLRARLLNIGKRHVIPESNWGTDCDQGEETGHCYICLKNYILVQKEMNECVSHHQLILE